MKSTKKISLILIVVTLVTVVLSIGVCANYFETQGGINRTYINTDRTFSTWYYTSSNPTLEYRYKNLICEETNAALSVSLYACKIEWYNIIFPSEYLVGTKNCSGLNAGNDYWYGWTYENIDCSSASEIEDKFGGSYDQSYNIRYQYEVSNNNGKYIHNNYDEWQVICSY